MIHPTDAIAAALIEAGLELFTHVPGYGGTECFEALRRMTGRNLPMSYHEESAYTIAHGAALTGTRAAALMKSHGAAKAANSIIDSLFAGTEAALLLLVFDDRQGKHSDSIFDIDGFLEGCRIPCSRLDGGDPRSTVFRAIEQSERLRLPVALVMEAGESDVSDAPRLEPPPLRHHGRERDITRHLVGPLFAIYQRDVLEAKLSGSDPDALPVPPLPIVPDSLPPAWREAVEVYRPFFEAFRAVRGSVVTGDTGLSSLFALPPFNCVDITTYMGGSVPLALGAMLAGHRDAWSVTGDFSFIAAGHLGLIEALERDLPLKTVIFDNRRAETTGGQKITDGVLDRILTGYERYVREVPAADRVAIDAVLAEAKRADEMRIVVVRC